MVFRLFYFVFFIAFITLVSCAKQETAVPDEFKKIEKVYLTEIGKKPGNISAVINLANLYYDSGLWKQAVKYYEKALKIQPGNAGVGIDLANCYINIKDYKGAEDMLNSVLAQYPDNTGASVNLGILYYMQNKREQAKSQFEKILDISSDPGIRKKAQKFLSQIENGK